MTTIQNLLARRELLVQQLKMASSIEDRDEIERKIEQIDTALNLLDKLGPSRDP